MIKILQTIAQHFYLKRIYNFRNSRI